MKPSFRRLAIFSAAACSLALPLDPARAALTDFSAFILNAGGDAATAPTLNADQTALTITTQGASDANSAFSTTPQTFGGGFSASFEYQVTNNNGGSPADGFTFTLQSEATTAVGSGGSSLAYAGATPVTPSVALAFDIYSTTANEVALSTGGTLGTYNNIGLTINGGDLIQMNVNYVAATTALTLTVQDLTTTSAVQTLNFTTNVTTDLSGGTLPSGQAYVGFTGATGGSSSTQVISAFSAVPEPGTWAVTAAGLGLLLIVQSKRRLGGHRVA